MSEGSGFEDEDVLQADLARVMNGQENGSNTPDFILASYLNGALKAFDAAVTARDKWYDCEHAPGYAARRNGELDRAYKRGVADGIAAERRRTTSVLVSTPVSVTD